MLTSRQQFIDQIADQLINARRSQTEFSLDDYDLTEEEKEEILDFYKIERIFAFIRENYDSKVAREALYGKGNIPSFIDDSAGNGNRRNGRNGKNY